MEKLNETQIQEKLSSLEGWSLKNGELEKSYSFKDFKGSMSFIMRLSLIAEQADHHPDIDIRYNRVTLRLSTHSAGGITHKDFSLAQEIDS